MGILLGPKPYGSDSYVDVVVPSEPHHNYLRVVLLLASSLLKVCRVREVHFRFHGVTIVPEAQRVHIYNYYGIGPKIPYYIKNYGSQFPNGCICGPSGCAFTFSRVQARRRGLCGSPHQARDARLSVSVIVRGMKGISIAIIAILGTSI